VKCGKCGAQFDVSTMKAGTAFACGKCRSVVQVPGAAPPPTVAMSPEQVKRALEHSRQAPAPAAAAPAPKAQPKLPPAMQKRAQATGAPTRAAGAAPAAAATQVAAPEAPRPAAKAARPVSSAPVKKAPVALYAGIGVVAVGGIAAFLVMSGGSDKPTEPAKTAEAPKPPEQAAPVKPKDPANFDDFLSMTDSEKDDALKSRLLSAGSDLAKLKELHDWATNAKVASNAAAKACAGRVVESALKADSNAAWARTARGDKRLADLLGKIKEECSKSFARPDKEEKALDDRLGTLDANPWADSAEWTKYSDLVGKVRDREKRMSEDPRFLEAESKRDWVRANPMFKGFELTWIYADPYVIFQEVRKQDVRDTERKYDEARGEMAEVPKDGTSNPSKVKQNEEWARKGKLFAERDAIIFTELDRRFRELFAERYKLPTLKEKGRMLTGLVMWNRDSFEKLLKEAGQEVSPYIRAFYSPPQQKIFHYLSDESLQSLDEWKVEGGFVQKGSDQVTFHEGTHQLQHEYAAIFRGRPLRDDEIVLEPRKAMWFEEGIAEFMGSPEVDDGKTEFLQDVHWRHNRLLISRVAEGRGNRELCEKWTIAEFLKPNHNGELHDIGERLAPGHGGNMGSHFYARAWTFCHFLWYYDGGKYRAKFLDYLEEVLKGTQSSDKFAKIMGRPNANDWGNIEKEYEWYWQRVLERRVGQDRVTKQWFTPKTDAPEGKVEDDTDFCEIWAENHKGTKKDK
jgi:hypothetical protein